MATETSAGDGDRLPGAGQAPPLAALHPHGRLRPRRRGPDHRPGRRLLRLGRARQPLPRRPLSALFCVNIGHGRAEIAQAGADQAKELDFFTTWSYAHPRAIELAAQIASLAPGDLNRVFFTSGGSRRSSPRSSSPASTTSSPATAEQDEVHRPRDRLPRHHARARSRATGITGLRQPFEPLTPGGCHVPNTNLYRLRPAYGVENLAEADRAADRVRGPGDGRRRDPRAGPERRRLLRPARRLLPARARDLRPATTCC